MKFRQVHLDFHTSEKILGIGSQFDKKQFQDALKAGHVDSITVFSKCHHGWSYHPSEANAPHPHLTIDLLGAQIEAAHEIGVKTPVYISAGLDEKYANEHPEHIIRERDNAPYKHNGFAEAGYHTICFNTPYLQVLCGQVREVCEKYDADGIFMDITKPRVCYCHTCLRDRRNRGMDPFDEALAKAHSEEVYRNYTTAIRETVDSVKPGLPIFHNAGATPRGRRDLEYMSSHTEIESLPTAIWGYDNLPMIARYVQSHGRDFLGMTGKFHLTWGEFGGYKHPNALIYETALAVANGGKCSIGDQLHPLGRMDPETYRIIGKAYAEIEKRESWLDGVKQVTDIGLLSYDAWLLRHPEHAETNAANADVGALRLLLEGHYLFDILDEESDFTPYKLLILPDAILIDEPLREKLDAYLAQGGKLLATGRSGLDMQQQNFVYDFGVRYLEPCKFQPSYFAPRMPMGGCGIADYIIYAPAEHVVATDGEVLADQKMPYFERTAEHFCSHGHAPAAPEITGVGISQGKDGIYLAAQLFRDYAKMGTQYVKQALICAIDRCLAASKTLITSLPSLAGVTLMEQPERDRMILHLLYAPRTVKGNQKIEVIEDCVPLYRVPLSLNLHGRMPKKIYLAPTGEELPFSFDDAKRILLEVPEVQIHAMVVIEFSDPEENR